MISYSFRPSLFQGPVTYQLSGHALTSSNGRVLDFSDIKLIRLYSARGSGHVKYSVLPSGSQSCVIRLKRGRAIALGSYSFVGLGNFEDRSADFQPFVEALIREVAAANRNTIFISGMPLGLWGLWAFIFVGYSVLAPVVLGLLLYAFSGRGAFAYNATTIAVAALIGLSLYYYLPALGSDWPRRFNPR